MMSTRAGWGFVAMAIVVVLGLVALFLFNGNLTMGAGLERDPQDMDRAAGRDTPGFCRPGAS